MIPGPRVRQSSCCAPALPRSSRTSSALRRQMPARQKSAISVSSAPNTATRCGAARRSGSRLRSSRQRALLRSPDAAQRAGLAAWCAADPGAIRVDGSRLSAERHFAPHRVRDTIVVKCQDNAVPSAHFRHTKSAKKRARHESGAASEHHEFRCSRRADVFQKEALVSKNLLASILFAYALSVSPALAQNSPAPQPAASPPANANALTPDQAKRALDTLQDDTKRAQMIDTLRAIANTQPAPAANAPQAAPAPAAAPSPIPLAADSLGAELLQTLSEQFGETSREVAGLARTLTHFPAFYYWIVRTANDPS